MAIENARIKSTHLGPEDHGIMTFMLDLELSGGLGQGYGGWALDVWNEEKRSRVGTAFGLEVVKRLLSTIGIDRWERIPGMLVRIRREDDKPHGRIVAIGNIVEDKWFDITEVFSEFKS